MRTTGNHDGPQGDDTSSYTVFGTLKQLRRRLSKILLFQDARTLVALQVFPR